MPTAPLPPSYLLEELNIPHKLRHVWDWSPSFLLSLLFLLSQWALVSNQQACISHEALKFDLFWFLRVTEYILFYKYETECRTALIGDLMAYQCLKGRSMTFQRLIMKVNFHICFILDPILPNVVTNGDNNLSIGPLSADDAATEPSVILWAIVHHCQNYVHLKCLLICISFSLVRHYLRWE